MVDANVGCTACEGELRHAGERDGVAFFEWVVTEGGGADG
jgi:hypothetical protein